MLPRNGAEQLRWAMDLVLGGALLAIFRKRKQEREAVRLSYPFSCKPTFEEALCSE